ncbi:BC1881 family protein [Weissella cibaria]|uniref:BC1881 family protein n=1 Tax=Weissella cibaria TaxID=137591 RepID=UPI00119599EC|nr:BC1881 family protein [Weissella cibaria]TVV37846.1 BC1881 family protein [Weissella cibaria]
MGKSTKELTNELVRREGIEIIEVLPYEIATIKKDQTTHEVVGPAIILINQD